MSIQQTLTQNRSMGAKHAIVSAAFTTLILVGFLTQSRESIGSDIVFDSTSGVDLSTKFSVYGSSGPVVATGTAIGPQFTIYETTTITAIGAFTNSCYLSAGEAVCPGGDLPFLVEIYPSLNGAPDTTSPSPAFELTQDEDPFVISFEYAQMEMTLEPGVYFALFRAQNGDRGFLLSGAQSPFPYQSESTILGYVEYDIDESGTTMNHVAAMILGEIEEPSCDGDLNGDGRVNWYDLSLLFHQWGPCGNCVADFNGNGYVGWKDAVYLYRHFGDC